MLAPRLDASSKGVGCQRCGNEACMESQEDQTEVENAEHGQWEPESADMMLGSCGATPSADLRIEVEGEP
jgi:hypothetical protein